MSYLTIIQSAVDMIGNVRRPASVARSQDPTVRTMSALLNRAGQNLTRERGTWGAGWTALQLVHTFETVADQESYALPSGFQELIGQTAWDRDQYWRMRGSLSPRDWQAIRSGLIDSVALQRRFLIRRSPTSADRVFYLDPAPAASGDNLAFEYMTREWVCAAGGGTLREQFLDDDDESLLDDGLLVMEVVWRFRHAKGMEFLLDMTEWEQQKMKLLGQDANVEGVELGRRRHRRGGINVQETGFGGVG